MVGEGEEQGAVRVALAHARGRANRRGGRGGRRWYLPFCDWLGGRVGMAELVGSRIERRLSAVELGTAGSKSEKALLETASSIASRQR